MPHRRMRVPARSSVSPSMTRAGPVMSAASAGAAIAKATKAMIVLDKGEARFMPRLPVRA